jgi:alpha-glucosidase (family GH31 glycosyl hydrolase)
MKNLYTFIITFIVVSTAYANSFNRMEVVLKDGDFRLIINIESFQFRFENDKGEIIVPENDNTGLLLNAKPITRIKKLKGTKSEKNFSVGTEYGDKADVKVWFKDGVVKFSIKSELEKEGSITLQLGGMSIAHGLGDAGSYRESFNLLENSKNTYRIINNGGTQRWTSTFAIFPKNNIAGVYFTEGEKSVTINEDSYAMKIEGKENVDFYFFIGEPKTIYKNYKIIRNKEGFEDVQPKSRLFELGWESWDALGWNTSQTTVKEILQMYLDKEFPIKWAVTGSGFWELGGTTTSFGKWGAKFSKSEEFKKWMHQSDIKWMIGLRTNLIPEGGPYYPLTNKRDKNLKVNSFLGNDLSKEAREKGLLVNDVNGEILKITSGIFPIVPSYLLNGEAEGAASWYQQQYSKWGVDGIKEDTMMPLDSLTNIYNAPITEIAKEGGLVMVRNGNYTAPGTLSRINDTHASNFSKRIPINYLQYAASGFPNVYSDVAGVHNMHNIREVDQNIRHTWLLALTSGISVGAYPDKWTDENQKIFKKAIDFHYAIVPYMFNAAIKTYNTGYPYTLTPLSIAYSNDNSALEYENYQWMIGESLLATPLLKNHKTGKKDVYLPEGIWYEYETGTKFDGPKNLTAYEIPLGKIPVFVGGKGVLVERNYKSENLIAKVYPISKTSISYDFTYPNEKDKTEISYKSWGSSEKIKVKNLTSNKFVEFKIDDKSGSVSFEIEPNNNYQVINANN